MCLLGWRECIWPFLCDLIGERHAKTYLQADVNSESPDQPTFSPDIIDRLCSLNVELLKWSNSADPDQTPRSAVSNLGLLCLLRPVCLHA